MKKILAVILISTMLLSSGVSLEACWFTDMLNSGPVNFVCHPTPAQQQTAGQMLLALQMGVGVAGAFVGITATQVEAAFAVLTVIKNGGCFLIDQLKSAFEVVDASNKALLKTKYGVGEMYGKPKYGAPSLPEYPDLRVFVK